MKEFYNNLPVLVTGGAGFIGSHLTQKLVNLGARVTVLDNLSSGFKKNLEKNLEKIVFINGSITDINTCFKAAQNQKIVFHLAAFVSVPESVENPTECHKTNVNGTFNILEACRINGVERLVFSSSSAVYGITTKICKENMPCNPTSPYGSSKLIGEILCKQYAKNYDVHTVCLRYFNVFGKNQNPKGSYAAVIAKFKSLIKQNKPITIFGDGLQTRDFIPVNKVVDANLTLSMQDKKIMNGDSFNVATGKSITLIELFKILKKEFPKYNESPIFKPARPGDIKYSTANTQKIKQIVEKL